MEKFTKEQLHYHKTYIFKSKTNKKLFFEALPNLFSTAEAIEIGKNFNIPHRTVKSILSVCVPYLITQPKFGLYEKVESESESEYITNYYTPDEIKIIASDIQNKVPVKRIARVRGEQFGRKGDGMLKKIRQIKRSLEKGFTYEDVINKTTTEKYNNQNEENMSKLKFYTEEELEIMKSAIRSGEPISHIANRLSKEFNRHASGVSIKLHNLKKDIPVILKWEGPKRIRHTKRKPKLNVQSVEKQNPTEIGVEVPHGMTFEGKPKRIMLHSDHFRIYF